MKFRALTFDSFGQAKELQNKFKLKFSFTSFGYYIDFLKEVNKVLHLLQHSILYFNDSSGKSLNHLHIVRCH